MTQEEQDQIKDDSPWMSIKQTPLEGKYILYGNHRYVKLVKYCKGMDLSFEKELISFLPVTHWRYCEMPPNVQEGKWSKPNPGEASSAILK
jgi:hypothetical protein